MQDADALFNALRQSADALAVNALEALARTGSDEDAARINPLSLAARHGLDEDIVIGALLHASRLGLFDMSWNVLCPSCGGILGANTTLKSVRQEHYSCAFCAVDAEPNLDETVEISFMISPRIRRIAAHDPDSLPFWDYHRQIFFGSGLDFPPHGDFSALAAAAVPEAVELRAGERMILSLTPGEPPASMIVFDPVTHTSLFVTLEGEPTQERADLSLVLTTVHGVNRVSLRPGHCACRSTTARASACCRAYFSSMLRWRRF